MTTTLSPHIIEAGTDLDSFGPAENPSESIPPGIKLPPNPYFGPPPNLDESVPMREPAPLLPRIYLEPSTVDFIERFDNGLSEDAPSGVFRVRVAGMGERVLKIVCTYAGNYREISPDAVHKFHTDLRYFKGRNFNREADGYAALLREGVCAAGFVPLCYGWTTINQSDWPMPGRGDWLCHFRAETKPLRSLVLEYLPDASQMTVRWTNPETTKKAMLGLDMIHRAGVLQNDIHPRNILVLKDGRVAWIDFESASVWPSNRAVTYKNMQREKSYAYFWLNQRMLPWKWYTLRFTEYGQGKHADLEVVEADIIQKRGVILV
ncbi:hypothetical protein K439DRAFT_1611895 [Ramaria rubella]|nr:hypothetical protein K439DRAFT_1611895 [Ramaria rubella]